MGTERPAGYTAPVRSITLLPFTFALVALGCKDRDPSEHSAFTEEPEREPRQSDIVKVQTPVDPGVQIPCEALHDPEEVAAMLEQQVTIDDRNATKPDATSVCAIHRAGEPPSREVQKRRSEETGILGVLPGDELCTVETYCSVPSSVEGLVRRCEERGDELNDELGVPACVHTTQRGPRFAYTYRVYDAATECVYRVLGGPSVTDEDVVQSCTDMALTTLSPERIAGHAD